jgi:hypothetical protein
VSRDSIIALLGLGLPALFVAGCSITAVILWARYPARFRTLRMLLCLPLIGAIAGFPIGFLMGGADPGLFGRLKFGMVCALWFGNPCMTSFMLIGLLILGFGALTRRKSAPPS